MKKNAKLLIIVLSSGENEIEECLASINSQTGVEFEIYRIIDMPNKEAHDTLYKKIEKESSNFDIFVKVDADMVFFANDTLRRMVDYFVDNSLDHAAFSVLDWYSQMCIIGMHMFSNRCTWPHLDDSLFVDPTPNFPGKSDLVWEKPSPVAYHSPNPSLSQAIQFGFHRGLKIVQKNRHSISLTKAFFQYDLMKQVYNQYCLNKDDKRKAALYGVERAIKSRENTLKSRNDSYVNKIIFEYNGYNIDIIDKKYKSRWGVSRFGFNSLYRKTFFGVFWRYLLLALKAKLKK